MTPGPASRRQRRREPLRGRGEPPVVDVREADVREADVDLTPPIDLTATRAPARRRILILDDEPDVFGWLRIALEPLRWDVNGARTTSDALEMATRLLPDVVLLDQQLPDGTGIEVGRWLRINQPKMRLVMFSAYLDLPTEEEAAKLGITTISKVDTKALMATLSAIRADLDSAHISS